MYVLILALDLFQELKCPFFIINRNRRTHIYSREYYIAAKSTTWKLKTTSSIKSNSITRIWVLINISIFSQSNCTKQRVFTIGSLPSELEPVNS